MKLIIMFKKIMDYFHYFGSIIFSVGEKISRHFLSINKKSHISETYDTM